MHILFGHFLRKLHPFRITIVTYFFVCCTLCMHIFVYTFYCLNHFIHEVNLGNKKSVQEHNRKPAKLTTHVAFRDLWSKIKINEREPSRNDAFVETFLWKTPIVATSSFPSQFSLSKQRFWDNMRYKVMSIVL